MPLLSAKLTCDVVSLPEGGNATSDAISGLDDDDLHAKRFELLSCGQAGNSGSDNEHFSGRLRHREDPFVDAEVDVPVPFQKRMNPENDNLSTQKTS